MTIPDITIGKEYVGTRADGREPMVGEALIVEDGEVFLCAHGHGGWFNIDGVRAVEVETLTHGE